MLNEKKDFLKMDIDELYDYYISFVLSEPKAQEVICELKSSKRYVSDYEFRIMIDFSELIGRSHPQSDQEMFYTNQIMNYIEIIDRATALELWQLTANAWNNLAISYYNLVMFERALECYSHALRIEAEHNLYKLSPVIYCNMIGLYVQIDKIDKAWDCIEKAVEILEKHKEDIPRYWDKYVGIYSRYLYLKIRKLEHEQAQIKPYYDRVMGVDPDQLNSNSKCLQINSEFHYGFFYYGRKEFERVLKEAKDKFGLQQYILFCHECIVLSEYIGRDPEFYIQELIDLDERGIKHLPLPNIQTYDTLIDYYEKKGNEEKVSLYRVKYIEAVKEHLKELSEQQKYAVQTVEQLVMSDEFKCSNKLKNIEFKLIAQETLKTKRELEKTNKRIEIVGELGRKITATTDLNEVISTVYRIIREHVSADFFALVYADEEHGTLHSVAVYYKGVLNEDFDLAFDDTESSFAECYRKQEILKFYGPIEMNSKTLIYGDNDDMLSCIFIPLVLADTVIGVFSVQSSQINAYDGEAFEFLKEIEPYLSIALNNGIKSWKIEKEIEHRKQIQLELEEANAMLAKISSMDGLTQISSRRDFEDRFKKMLRKASKNRKSVSVFMMDIDFFKVYNDTYGHLEGDKILQKIAKVFEHHLEETNGLSARFGGEEFIGAVMGLDMEASKELADKICGEIAGLRMENKKTNLGYVTVSIGVAVAEKVNLKLKSDLMREADECLYAVKAQGKNRVVIKTV